jgi:hypothetical protein
MSEMQKVIEVSKPNPNYYQCVSQKNFLLNFQAYVNFKKAPPAKNGDSLIKLTKI